ncbi:hypothetical protein L1987_01549 [Smallanthus sonchifolius]|uniref:Uncharacterized protein n=1 Tax=Smallanthus sonchifolius TaxID=185202 RepID=A0ACB9K5G3_9ASTR|nr:hypothetical protein L1987_01549 [Smallanthus sonchifolius]
MNHHLETVFVAPSIEPSWFSQPPAVFSFHRNRLVYLFREPRADKDEELCKSVNLYLNQPIGDCLGSIHALNRLKPGLLNR